MLNVVAVDLIERAVAPALIVAAEYQPITRRRVLEHVERHGHVVLHFAVNGHAAKIAECAAASAAAGARAGPEHHGRASAAAATCVRIAAATTPTAAAAAACASDRAERCCRVGGQCVGAGRTAHSLEDV